LLALGAATYVQARGWGLLPMTAEWAEVARAGAYSAVMAIVLASCIIAMTFIVNLWLAPGRLHREGVEQYSAQEKSAEERVGAVQRSMGDNFHQERLRRDADLESLKAAHDVERAQLANELREARARIEELNAPRLFVEPPIGEEEFEGRTWFHLKVKAGKAAVSGCHGEIASFTTEAGEHPFKEPIPLWWSSRQDSKRHIDIGRDYAADLDIFRTGRESQNVFGMPMPVPHPGNPSVFGTSLRSDSGPGTYYATIRVASTQGSVPIVETRVCLHFKGGTALSVEWLSPEVLA
jgi:hypothetical protein